MRRPASQYRRRLDGDLLIVKETDKRCFDRSGGISLQKHTTGRTADAETFLRVRCASVANVFSGDEPVLERVPQRQLNLPS